MEISWLPWICLVIIWRGLKPAMSVMQDLYVPVSHIPTATKDTIIPYFVTPLQCAQRCGWEPTCQGFVMYNDQINPCHLLQGLNGATSSDSEDVQAYVSPYFNGIRYVFKTGTLTWESAHAYCQAQGMTLISYPIPDEQRIWLKGAAMGLVFVAAWKSDSTWYDLNNNNKTIEIDNWLGGYPKSNKGLASGHDGFLDVNHRQDVDGSSLVCIPRN